MIGTLSDIQQWKPDDLNNFADHYNDLADRRGNTMDAIQSLANSLDWTGEGKQGNQLVLDQHSTTADTQAQILRAAAQVAKDGGNTLYGLQQQVLKTVEDARDSGFNVGDDFTVTDAQYQPGTIPWAARQPDAAAIQATLVGQAGAFDSQRVATAGEITSSSAGLHHNTIHATPYPGDLMSRDREQPLPTPPGKAPRGAWSDSRTPYGDNFAPHKRLEQCEPDREVEDIAKAGLGVAGIASGNLPLGVLGATLGVEGSLKDLMKCEPPEGVH